MFFIQKCDEQGVIKNCTGFFKTDAVLFQIQAGFVGIPFESLTHKMQLSSNIFEGILPF